MTQEDRELLIKKGYSFLTTQKMNDNLAYIFVNKLNDYEKFSKSEKNRFIITNKITLV